MKKKEWKQKVWRFRDRIEFEEYKDGRYGARGKSREKKKKATPEQIQRQNRTNKVKTIRRYILANYSPGDYWVTLTCKKDQRPNEVEEAVKQRKKLLDKLRTKYRKAGYELKWIAVTEKGSRGGVHHHLIINRIPDGDKILKESWTYGKVWMELLYEDGGYHDLAEYLVKQTEEAEEAKYSHSRNLIKPEPRIRYTKRLRRMTQKKGYYIEKESVVEGINPVTGFRYRHYAMVRIKKRE